MTLETPIVKILRTACLATLVLLLALGAAAESWKPKPMPAAEETAEALAAGPPSIRAGAGVYLLGAYAPYLTNADFGGDLSGEASPIFLINEGEPGAYVIVPVGEH